MPGHRYARSNAGFSLVELMLVVAIIGLLSTMARHTYLDMLGRARDARRIADMHAIKRGMQGFFVIHDRYPDDGDGIAVTGEMIGVGNPIDTLLENYIDGGVPRDPLHDGSVYFYSYSPLHCTDSTRGTCDCAGNAEPVIAFNKAEFAAKGMVQETCSGTDMNINNADYNKILTEIY